MKKKNEQGLREIWDTTKKHLMCIMGIPEREKLKGTEKYYKKKWLKTPKFDVKHYTSKNLNQL